MSLVWQKIDENTIASKCGKYRIKRLNRTHIIFAAEIRVSELCWVTTWLTHTSGEAKQKCNDDNELELSNGT